MFGARWVVCRQSLDGYVGVQRQWQWTPYVDTVCWLHRYLKDDKTLAEDVDRMLQVRGACCHIEGHGCSMTLDMIQQALTGLTVKICSYREEPTLQ